MLFDRPNIVCRECDDVVPDGELNCPSCGTERRTKEPLYGIGLGGLFIAVTLVDPASLWLIALVGLAFVGVAALLLMERRDRIHRATGEG